MFWCYEHERAMAPNQFMYLNDVDCIVLGPQTRGLHAASLKNGLTGNFAGRVFAILSIGPS